MSGVVVVREAVAEWAVSLSGKEEGEEEKISIGSVSTRSRED